MSIITQIMLKGGDTLLRNFLAARGCATAKDKLGETMCLNDTVAVCRPKMKNAGKRNNDKVRKMELVDEINHTREALDQIQEVESFTHWAWDYMTEEELTFLRADLKKVELRLKSHREALYQKL